MDEIVQLVASEPEDNDEMTVFKIKASNTGLLLEAFKDGRKWHKDSRTECTRFASVSGYTFLNTKYLFFKQIQCPNRTNLRVQTSENCSASGNHQSYRYHRENNHKSIQ